MVLSRVEDHRRDCCLHDFFVRESVSPSEFVFEVAHAIC
jgi:hypothetical protein